MQDSKVIERIKALEIAGIITADAVLEDAKNEESPLHKYFEWDDSKAATMFRKDQARELIRSVRLVLVEDKFQIATVAYVRNPDAAHDEQGYSSVMSLRTDKDRARRALVAELQRAENALQRAYDVGGSLGLSKEIQTLLAQLRNVSNAA
jgi:hypothetical protein